MSGWNKDNFLERLMPQLRQQGGAERDPCPDAETLLAALEGEAPASVREQVAEHLKQCPDCAELQKRLVNFDAEPSPEPEAVWKETRKRLDNWLEGFLRSPAANVRAAKPAAPSRKDVRWEAFWSPFVSWKVVWGVGVAALLVLIADAVLVMELRRGRPPQVQVAARPAVPQKQPANAQPPEKPAVGGPLVGARTNQEHPPVGAPLVGARTNQEHPPVGAPLVGARTNQEHGQPQVAERLPSNPQRWRTQAAGASGGHGAAPLPPSPPLNAAAAPAAEYPPSLRLKPDAHLLLMLSSVKLLPDGSLQFHGTLLVPVVHPGSVPLDRGAEVIGTGTMTQGQTSLAITEFVVQGARYTLKAGSGAMKTQTPGASGGVHFDRSQVLEMWPASPSVYEKAPDTTAQPEPQK